MELVNNTPLPALVFEKSGRFSTFYYVVIARATYDISLSGKTTLADIQEGYIVADEYFDEPFENSALKRETDLVLYKPYCDIYFHGHAHASKPPQSSWPVQIQYRGTQKNFIVTGPKNWYYQHGRWQLSASEAVKSVALDYRLAFGGNPDPENRTLSPFANNTAGIGFYKKSLLDTAKIYPAPQFESTKTVYDNMKKPYPVEGLSPLCRWWPERTQHLGTYDKHWEQHIHPFHPDDFNEQFYNVAPEGLTIPYPSGGETIYTLGLFKNGARNIVLPENTIQLALGKDGSFIPREMNMDTIVVDTDQSSLAITWRAISPVDDMHEIAKLGFSNEQTANMGVQQ